MTRRHWLQTRTRAPAFLWRMVLVILGAGFAIGLVVDAMTKSPADAGHPLGTAPEQGGVEWREVERLAARHEWGAAWQRIPRLLLHEFTDNPGHAFLAMLTGLCWLAFAIQSAQMRSARDVRLWGPLAGIVLGVLSIWPTIFFIFYQQYAWGLKESQNFGPGVKYFILGVGLREELAKLLAFAILLPWLVRRGDELAAFMTAACVGIGFGMEENINYITESIGSATLGRLLSSTPFHMAATGLIGLAAYRACRWPKEWTPQFLLTFGGVVCAHGLYDALIAVQGLNEFALGSSVIFVLLVYQFFRELRPLQQLRVEPVSLTANFLFCVSTVAAATFIYLSALVGWQAAADALVTGIVGQATLVYLFLREMPERLISV